MVNNPSITNPLDLYLALELSLTSPNQQASAFIQDLKHIHHKLLFDAFFENFNQTNNIGKALS
jgi:hypothetical protein